MPEGHSVHRIARQFDRNFVGRRVSASSPQGRFVEGASILDGRTVTAVQAVGKQMFMEFDGGVWLRVHLGIYGAWDFAGEIMIDPTIASANGRMGHTNQRGTVVDAGVASAAGVDTAVFDSAGENSLASIGAPRKARVHVRMSEETSGLPDAPDERDFPPEPVGAVRLRLLTDVTVADLRGPTACQVQTPDEVEATIAKLGPDPLLDDGPVAEQRVVDTIRSKQTSIGRLLMDQSVIAGIGNVYRAEMLFRARLNPHTPGKKVPEDLVREMWRDWSRLLRVGVETGQMMTMDDLEGEEYRLAMANRADRHWVYHRAGLPCRVCGTEIVLEEMAARKLYWCPACQE
ncbi:MAG TPA: DNA-formamidopyrimidine glycosylase family protein [Microbacteriaceae bacterium]|mgnify:FL=1|nr:DNA-formamidopyrimidine glycosylase family protein [Microbacteriaceae bacterium]HQX34836.1 DNA-formamidopyrimidine glycosylase family protein [Microbacteriaceae bacterium]HQZ48057.1 DNA-formamidopyrimidine glycosylase family protein [Microbacteriaceae bacterium]HRA08102.1 DNA-formamidopyrimidine glycosylase family protein [Microbacteriaceae bacterium]